MNQADSAFPIWPATRSRITSDKLSLDAPRLAAQSMTFRALLILGIGHGLLAIVVAVIVPAQMSNLGLSLVALGASMLICAWITRRGHLNGAIIAISFAYVTTLTASAIQSGGYEGIRLLCFNCAMLIVSGWFLPARWYLPVWVYISLLIFLAPLGMATIPPFELTLMPIILSLLCGSIVMLMVTISRRIDGLHMQMEREAAERYEHLLSEVRESEERYRLISETMSDYIGSVINVPGEAIRWEWVTDSITAITGFRGEEMGQQPPSFWYHPDDFPRVKADWERVRAGETVEGEYRVPLKAGGYKWLRITRRPTITYDGKQRVYVMGRDITVQKQSEARQIELALERERFSTISQFVRAVSHDFRTVLSVIETNRYLLERMSLTSVAEDQRDGFAQRLKMIRESVQHIVTQLDNMRVVAAATAPTHQSVSLSQVARQVSAAVSAQIRDRSLTLDLALASDLPVMIGDPAEIERALRHLLENSMTHTPAGGIITVRTKAESDRVILEVSDTGKGIAGDHLPHIFDPFYKVDPARNLSAGGVGFGLTVAKVVSEMFHGRISVSSTVNVGTVITLSFPAAKDETVGLTVS